MFKKNVHPWERAGRVILGLALLAAFFALPDLAWRWVLLIGIVPLVTGLAGSCPLYTVFGFSTCPTRNS